VVLVKKKQKNSHKKETRLNQQALVEAMHMTGNTVVVHVHHITTVTSV